MIIEFGQSEGNVMKYIFELSAFEGGESEKKTTFTNEIDFNLKNKAKYNYTITAYNTEGDPSVSRTGYFTTFPAREFAISYCHIFCILMEVQIYETNKMIVIINILPFKGKHMACEYCIKFVLKLYCAVKEIDIPLNTLRKRKVQKLYSLINRP